MLANLQRAPRRSWVEPRGKAADPLLRASPNRWLNPACEASSPRAACSIMPVSIQAPANLVGLGQPLIFWPKPESSPAEVNAAALGTTPVTVVKRPPATSGRATG